MPWIGPELDEGFDLSVPVRNTGTEASKGTFGMTSKTDETGAAAIARPPLTVNLPRPGGYITVSLADGLEILESYFERYSDVDDGPYGEPVANEAMSLLSLVKDLQEAFCDGEPNE
jgi:hypothetical protein